MSKENTFDFIILGAGLAGVSTADKLVEKGFKVALIDKRGIAEGASGTPLGLVNPATGRFANLNENALSLYSAVIEKLEWVQSQTNNIFFKKSGVLRPATDYEIFTKMKSNFIKTDWPENWAEWLDEKDVQKLLPRLNFVGGALWLPIGASVEVKTYLEAYVSILEKKGLNYFQFNEFDIENKPTKEWYVKSASEEYLSENLVVTAGYESRFLKEFSALKIHPVKGQIAVFKVDDTLIPPFAISALGYISSINKRELVVGSTYEHKFESEETDQAGLDYLNERVTKVLPDILKSSTLINQWSGIRGSTPNRKPIVGKHPEFESLSVYSGLGSKGLLYSEYYASKLVEHLIDKTEIEKEYSISRFFKP